MCLLYRLFCRHSLIYGNSGSFSGSSPNNIYIHRLIHNQNTQLSLKAVSVHYYILLQYYSSSTLLYIHTFYTFRTLRFFDVSPPFTKRETYDAPPYSTHTQTYAYICTIHKHNCDTVSIYFIHNCIHKPSITSVFDTCTLENFCV